MTTTNRALAALGLTLDALLRILAADLAKHGVLAGTAGALALGEDYAPCRRGEVKVGDLVLVFGYQRYRFARVWAVTPSKLSAIYLAPASLVYPNCVTVKMADAALVEAAPVPECAITDEPAVEVAPAGGIASQPAEISVGEVTVDGMLPLAGGDGFLF